MKKRKLPQSIVSTLKRYGWEYEDYSYYQHDDFVKSWVRFTKQYKGLEIPCVFHISWIKEYPLSFNKIHRVHQGGYETRYWIQTCDYGFNSDLDISDTNRTRCFDINLLQSITEQFDSMYHNYNIRRDRIDLI
jgi:hypothetical protein